MWVKTKQLAAVTLEIFKTAGKQYALDRVNRMAAAVAYRTMFALAPLLLLAVYFLGLVVGGDIAARVEIHEAIERVAGETVANAVGVFLDSVSTSGSTAGLVGFVLLLWTGSSLFLELQNDLNDIFAVPYEQTSGILETVKKRGLGFLWALGMGVLLVLVWLLNSLWQFIGNFLPEKLGTLHLVIAILAPVVSLVVLPFVFALITQTLTQVKVRWRAIWLGSLFTSFIFLLAAYGTSLYFSISGTSAASIAASLFVVLLLAYVLSAVFLFGIEVIKVYDRYLRSGIAEAPLPPGPEGIVASPQPALPVSAVIGFLGGLIVGWRRKS
jgi:membrane protein